MLMYLSKSTGLDAEGPVADFMCKRFPGNAQLGVVAWYLIHLANRPGSATEFHKVGGDVFMPEQSPEKPSPKKWEEMTLEEKVEDLNQRMHGSRNWLYRVHLFLEAYIGGMFLMGVGALSFGWPVLWLTGWAGKTWSEPLLAMVAGMVGAFVGLLAFIKLCRPWLHREWEASYSGQPRTTK
jgi:hypothetical protein